MEKELQVWQSQNCGFHGGAGMNEHITKAWDWSKNTDNQWLIPCTESAYLCEKWQGQDFSRLLDLGCGLGRHSVYMASKGFDVTAVDLSDYAVNHLREWAEKVSLDIKAVVCNMLSLPFKDNSFDCVIAYNVIYHTDTKGFIASLDEIRRIIKPNGEMFITLISKNTHSYQHADLYKRVDENTILRDEHETEKNVPHFYVDIEDIKRLFSAWNFEKHPVEWCDYNMDNPEFYSKHWSLLVRK
jgi:2-polyprenyl-3-methyl-5-hydroxy-6-metoxy-1,4-benzoquinol methylase